MDPDGIALCQALKVCPINDDGAANITSVVISPESGPRGTTFTMQMTFEVLNKTGTGEIEVVYALVYAILNTDPW